WSISKTQEENDPQFPKWNGCGAGNGCHSAAQSYFSVTTPSSLGRVYGSVPPSKIVVLSRLPRGRTRNTTSWPLFICDSIFWKSASLFTGCLLISRITSPRASPELSPKPPGFTSCTMTPLELGSL